MKKIVLITGAAGFVGRYTAKKFASEGWYVIGIGRGDWIDWEGWGLNEWIQSDITLNILKSVENVDFIVHCAGGASVGKSLEQPQRDFESTVITTDIVLEYIRLFSSKTRLIYISSAAVYGQALSLPICEDAELRPTSPYGVHKLMAESLCKSYAHTFQLNISIVRLFSIYGDGLQKQLLWDACEKFSKQSNQFFGSGQEIRDWLHVKDAADLIYLLQKLSSVDCPIFNGAFGRGVSTSQILNFLTTLLNSRCKPEFSSKTKAGDPLAYVADISKVKALGWKPKISWENGVKKYVEWYRR